MLPPFPCPGSVFIVLLRLKIKIPKSYTGFEPSTLRAQRLNYDAYQIVLNRINQLDATGNFANKIELIFQGSSFTALPKTTRECGKNLLMLFAEKFLLLLVKRN